MYDESLYARRALNAGARGYIMKQETSDLIVKAIHTVLKGKVYVSDSIVSDILDIFTGKSDVSNMPSIEKLTNRELDIFRMIGRGVSTGDIAKKLNISVKTVGTYRERIKEKLNLKNAAELVRFAIQWFENNK